MILTLSMGAALILSAWSPAFAATGSPAAQAAKSTKTTEALGNQGIFLNSKISTTRLWMDKIESNTIAGLPVRAVAPALQVNSKIGEFPTTLSYVYFDLNKGMEKQGRLSIWFKTQNGQWQPCTHTFFVDRSSKKSGAVSIDGNAPAARIACLMTRWDATYILGVPLS